MAKEKVPLTSHEKELFAGPNLGNLIINWEHRDGRQTLKGKYNTLVVTHITTCTILDENRTAIGEATLHCSEKDTYDPWIAKYNTLKAAVKDVGWTSKLNAEFYDSYFATFGVFPKHRKRRKVE
jgi:hypothetical protein